MYQGEPVLNTTMDSGNLITGHHDDWHSYGREGEHRGAGLEDEQRLVHGHQGVENQVYGVVEIQEQPRGQDVQRMTPIPNVVSAHLIWRSSVGPFGQLLGSLVLRFGVLVGPLATCRVWTFERLGMTGMSGYQQTDNSTSTQRSLLPLHLNPHISRTPLLPPFSFLTNVTLFPAKCRGS
jgi:hypothetical protein